eukprot:2361910-Pleurochrysis_carterae.AAC.1
MQAVQGRGASPSGHLNQLRNGARTCGATVCGTCNGVDAAVCAGGDALAPYSPRDGGAAAVPGARRPTLGYGEGYLRTRLERMTAAKSEGLERARTEERVQDGVDVEGVVRARARGGGGG